MNSRLKLISVIYIITLSSLLSKVKNQTTTTTTTGTGTETQTTTQTTTATESVVLNADFKSVRQKKEVFCKNYKTNYLYKMSLERATHSANSQNLFMSFSQGVLPILLGESVLSNAVGLIPVVGLPLFLLLANFVSLIMFILYLCPGYFKTRKENLSAKKQKLIIVFTLVCIVGMGGSYVMFSSKLDQAIDESKYSVCMFYNAQFDVFNGLEENFGGNNYSFLGFDRLESYTQIFNEELTYFSDLMDEFVDIRSKNFDVQGKRPIKATNDFAAIYSDKKTLTTTEDVLAQPVWSQSLTTFISDEMEVDLKKMESVSENLNQGATTGKEILDSFESDNYVLVSSMSRAMDFIINKFKKLINSSVELDQSLTYVLNFFDTFRYFLLVLGIMFFAFIPFYVYYYCVRTTNDEKVYLDKIMKLVNLFINFMGYISGVLLLILVFVVVMQSCFCFYLSSFIGDSTFYQNNKDLFQIKDAEMVVILENCLNQEKAKFSFIFNQDTTATTTTTTTTTGGTAAAAAGARILDEVSFSNNSYFRERFLETTTEDGGSFIFGNQGGTKGEAIPVDFNTAILTKFQGFVKNMRIYNNYKADLGGLLPESVTKAEKNVLSFRDGLEYSFVNYVQALDYINTQLDCTSLSASINIRNCTAVGRTCLELRKFSDEQFATKIATELCITDKNSLIQQFTVLRKSLENNYKFYDELFPFIGSNLEKDGYNTPGKEIEKLNQNLLEISPKVDEINRKLGNTFKILETIEGNLDVLTNCYIVKRQLSIIEPGFCFVMLPTMVTATLFIFLVNIFVIGATWGVFLTIKYAGDLGEKG